MHEADGGLRLAAARVEMAEFAGLRALVIERFDRRWTHDGHLLRLPQKDMCQATGTPPAIKCEADGGPGLQRLLRLLAGSDDPIADRGALLKAGIAFWLPGATDVHAKNVSVFLHPGGRFSLTPFYDVLSAQPAIDAGQLCRNRFRLSMAVGNRRHYVIDSILPRHFLQTALASGIGASITEAIFAELATIVPQALEDTLADLPTSFRARLQRWFVKVCWTIFVG